MFGPLICVCIGYAFGCILSADIVARLLTGRSAFEIGDGNPGMANVGHELGTKAAVFSLLGDILKTVLAVLVAHLLFPELETSATAWAGLGATLGHIFPFWHGMRGGKGVTTIASTIILMNPFWGIVAGLVGVVSIVVTGYLSMAAVLAMTFYVAAMLVIGATEGALVSIVFLVLTLYAHGSKLLGIVRGTTKRAGLASKVRNLLKRR